MAMTNTRPETDSIVEKKSPIGNMDHTDDSDATRETCVVRVSLGLEALAADFRLDTLLLQRNDIDISPDTLDHLATLQSSIPSFPSPFAWSTQKKLLVMSGPFMASLLAAYAAGAYALAGQELERKWHRTDVELNIGITLFVAGFGFTPMVLAPVSEAHGRYWVFVGSGLVFFFGTLGCALTETYAGMLASRLITGCGAAVYAALTGGVVSDVYADAAQRNTPMTLYTLAIMAGTGLGPLISGAAVKHIGWRWIFYLQLIAVGATTLWLFFTFEETRSNVLLARNCDTLNNAIKNKGSRITTNAGDEIVFAPPTSQETKVDFRIIFTSFTFPLRLLFTESVVFWFSIWISFAWSILYMQFSSIGFVFRRVYDFDSMQVGAVYTSVIVGALLGTLLALLPQYLNQNASARTSTPERRLLSPGVLSVLLPVGLFWFGCTAQTHISWVSPAIAIGACTLGIFSIYLAVFNYLADTYHSYASSAIAASSMCRNLLAGIFPLFTSRMLRDLTLVGTGCLLGGLGVLLTAIPWLLFFFGKKIRSRSPFARELQDDAE